MCKEEMEDTLRYKKPSVFPRVKFFSHDKAFVVGRVMDGSFNHSKFKTERYERLLEFQILDSDLQYFDRIGKFELSLNRKNIGQIKWISVKEVERCCYARY